MSQVNEFKNEIKDLLSLYARRLNYAGVKVSQIKYYLNQELYTMNDFRECNRWINNHLRPKMDALTHQYEYVIGGPDAYRELVTLNINHPMLIEYRKLQRDLKEEWLRRPRFDGENKRRKRMIQARLNKNGMKDAS